MNTPNFETNCKLHGTTMSYLNGECIACSEHREEQKRQQLKFVELKRRKENANIPVKFFNINFDQFICDDDEMIRNKQTMEHWDFTGNLFLFGKTGNGKTHLAIACLIKFLEESGSGYYTKFYKLPHIQITDKRLYDKILTTELLVLDEFGSSATDYKSQLLFELIDERYDNNLSTIFITNRTPDEINQFLTDATLSRIKECCNTLFFNSIDKRKSIIDIKSIVAGDR